MARFVILYAFHKIDSLSLNRLRILRRMNPDVTFVPFFGIRQKIYFPTLIDLKRAPARILNLYFLKFKTVYDLSHYVNKKLESFRRKSEIDKVRNALEEICLSLYCDYTPLGYYNLDLAIRNWFSVEGNNLDFDFLIFFEYDMYATKPIAHLYAKYTTYDAGFVGYGKVDSSWYWYNRPPGARKSIISWLVKRGLKPYLYCGVFAGHMVSREVLTCLEKTPLPYGFCEMRWPSIIAGLGFKCTNLNFPMVRYGRPIHKSEIIANERLGLFHPVYEDIDLSTK